MNIISLFDGISCAYVALKKAGIPIKSYTAYEIDKYAINISKKNNPDIIHKGNVLDLVEYVECDLLIGGSPCTDLSMAKKNRQGLEGEHSKLFWEYVRIKKILTPKYFILENVASMPKKDKDIITKEMGVEPIMFDASLVSAQRRKRLFWTNISFTLPIDKGIVVKDILESEVDDKYYIKKTLEEQLKLSNSQANRVYEIDGKSVCLQANAGGTGAKTGLYKIISLVGRRLDKNGKRCDNDNTIDYTQHISIKKSQDKMGTLTSVSKDNLIAEDIRIRRLTPKECERLQGLPDNYTSNISDSQRYKCLGNAFNVDVISHIIKHISCENI